MGTLFSHMASLRKGRWHYLVVKFLDIDETRCLHALPLEVIRRHREGPPQHLSAFNAKLAPLVKRRILRDLHVVTFEGAGRLEALDPPTGATGRVGLGEEGVPVRNAANEPAEVDVVERGCWESPRLGTVLNLAGEGRGVSGVWEFEIIRMEMGRTISDSVESRLAEWGIRRSR